LIAACCWQLRGELEYNSSARALIPVISNDDLFEEGWEHFHLALSRRHITAPMDDGRVTYEFLVSRGHTRFEAASVARDLMLGSTLLIKHVRAFQWILAAISQADHDGNYERAVRISQDAVELADKILADDADPDRDPFIKWFRSLANYRIAEIAEHHPELVADRAHPDFFSLLVASTIELEVDKLTDRALSSSFGVTKDTARVPHSGEAAVSLCMAGCIIIVLSGILSFSMRWTSRVSRFRSFGVIRHLACFVVAAVTVCVFNIVLPAAGVSTEGMMIFVHVVGWTSFLGFAVTMLQRWIVQEPAAESGGRIMRGWSAALVLAILAVIWGAVLFACTHQFAATPIHSWSETTAMEQVLEATDSEWMTIPLHWTCYRGSVGTLALWGGLIIGWSVLRSISATARGETPGILSAVDAAARNLKTPALLTGCGLFSMGCLLFPLSITECNARFQQQRMYVCDYPEYVALRKPLEQSIRSDAVQMAIIRDKAVILARNAEAARRATSR
jgi:hypothetical protein